MWSSCFLLVVHLYGPLGPVVIYYEFKHFSPYALFRQPKISKIIIIKANSRCFLSCFSCLIVLGSTNEKKRFSHSSSKILQIKLAPSWVSRGDATLIQTTCLHNTAVPQHPWNQFKCNYSHANKIVSSFFTLNTYANAGKAKNITSNYSINWQTSQDLENTFVSTRVWPEY